MFEISTGFESAQIFGSGVDILDLTNHTKRFAHDLKLLRSDGICLVRYSAPWHKIEVESGRFDWIWMDRAMKCMQALELTPIIDPLHLTSFPSWLKNGFANKEFPLRYCNFVQHFAQRYPWVARYTVVNEPSVMAWLSGYQGLWYPYQRGFKHFVPMLLNITKAMSTVTRMLSKEVRHLERVHIDVCETHRSIDGTALRFVEFRNQMRFLTLDLMLGKVKRTHPLFAFLARWASEREILWFEENPEQIDILGLDYYPHCEFEWRRHRGKVERRSPNTNPVGFAPIAREYWKRYALPVMLAETNLRGFISDRITWFKFITEECETLLNEQLPLRGLCWYPYIDSTDWDSLLQKAQGNVDPQGIYWLDAKRWKRHRSDFSQLFSEYARGIITSKAIPPFKYRPPVNRHLEGYTRLRPNWDWLDPKGT